MNQPINETNATFEGTYELIFDKLREAIEEHPEAILDANQMLETAEALELLREYQANVESVTFFTNC